MLMSRQEMLCTVHYPGPGSCQLYISSHTTANEVWAHFCAFFFFKARLFSIFQLLYLIIDLGCFEIAMPSFSWIKELDGTRFVVLNEPKNKLEKTP